MNVFESLIASTKNNFKDSNSINVNPNELKSISSKLNEAIQELNQADKDERLAWEAAKTALGPKMSLQLSETFEKTDNEYYNALFTLNKFVDSLNRVSNIWENAEERIMKAINIASSSKE